MLNVSGSNIGRFSASLASIKDLNGDSLADVAVGAPLENDGEGVVYIYLGDGIRGINLNHAPQVRVCFALALMLFGTGFIMRCITGTSTSVKTSLPLYPYTEEPAAI